MSRTLEAFFAPGLFRRLHRATAGWAKRLPAHLFVAPSAIFPPLARQMGHSPDPTRPELSHLAGVLLDGYIPAPAIWAAALREEWEAKRKASDGDLQPFFVRGYEEVRPHLERLAEALYRVCAEDPKRVHLELLQRTAVQQVLSAHTPQSALITAEEFFRPLVNTERLFHHAWELVGREETLNRLLEFAMSSQERIAVLPGRGGIGKTKLLWEFAKRFEEVPRTVRLRFVMPDIPFTATITDELSQGPFVVVMDDAHAHEHL